MMNVIGNWGAMFPHSYGEITKIDEGKVTIVWEDGALSYTSLDKIKREWATAVGIYFNPEG